MSTYLFDKELFDIEVILGNDDSMCLLFSFEALQQATENGIAYDIDPNTYVADFFDGVQPSKAEFLQFLAQKGFDTDVVQKNVLDQLQETKDRHLRAQANATKFFELFMGDVPVTAEEVNKYIDDASIYFLLELAASNSASTKAQAAARKRHSGNYLMKSSVFAWLDLNMAKFKSMDAAAEAVIREKPIAFRTARAWTSEWKKLRSARKQ